MFNAQKNGIITVKTYFAGDHYRFIFPHSSFSYNSQCKEIFSLQTGHCLLNHHKHRIRLHRIGLYETCNVSETVPRFLLQSKKYLPSQVIFKNYVESVNSKFNFKTMLSDKSVNKFLLSFFSSCNKLL